MSSKGHRAREKSRSRAEVVAPPIEQKSVENAVSKVQEDRKNRAWWAKDLLKLTASFITEHHKRHERERPWQMKEFPSRPTNVLNEEKYVRAAIYVAGHEKFKAYEATFYEVYVDGTKDTMAMERMSEFELALDAQLDKVPFVAERQLGRSKEATDAVDALIPITTCAKFLGIGRSTLHRWLNAGLMAKGVRKFGNDYFINYLVALDWKVKHYKAHRNPHKNVA